MKALALKMLEQGWSYVPAISVIDGDFGIEVLLNTQDVKALSPESASILKVIDPKTGKVVYDVINGVLMTEKPKKYVMKPLQFVEGADGVVKCYSPTHTYSIRREGAEVKVSYLNHTSNEYNERFLRSIEEAKDWIVNTHVPSKLRKYFEEVE